MTDTANQDRLDAMPADREQQYASLFATYDTAWKEPMHDDQIEDADRAIDESILAVEQKRGFDVTISTGGPAEWLECTVDTDDDLEMVHFVCAWWSTPQRTIVYSGSGLWRLAERMNPYSYQ